MLNRVCFMPENSVIYLTRIIHKGSSRKGVDAYSYKACD